MRTLVIGDIHGSIQSLQEGLKMAGFEVQNDRLICIGDYIDGWGGDVEVVQLLMELQRQSPFDNIYLAGNHDAWLHEVLKNDLLHFRDKAYIRSMYPAWIEQGGASTYASYMRLSDSELIEHKVHFYDQLKYYHLENNKLFVHAGFDVDTGWNKTLETDPGSLLWNRSLFERALDDWKRKENSNFGNFEKIYIGHTPTVKFGIHQPVRMGNVINIDQGCKLNGRLTIWVDDDDTWYQTSELKLL